MNIADLRPSELAKLPALLVDPTAVDGFLKGLHHFLLHTVPDGGAESDRIFTTTLKLSHVKVWDHIPVHTLALTVADVPGDRMGLFVEGLRPDRYGTALLSALIKTNGLPTSDPSEFIRNDLRSSMTAPVPLTLHLSHGAEPLLHEGMRLAQPMLSDEALTRLAATTRHMWMSDVMRDVALTEEDILRNIRELSVSAGKTR
ncbi:hypothetical protein [Agrobacterium sp. CG674]